MIKYDQGSFGFVVLFRLHGTTFARAQFLACFGVVFSPLVGARHSSAYRFSPIDSSSFASFSFLLGLPSSGSALFKSVFPALISSAIYVALLYTTDVTHDEILDDAYPMGALIAALTFLLAFRANNSHSRWWEAYTCVTNMHTKFLDVGTSLAAFHLQALKYHSKKPPAFGEHPDIDFVERQRIRVKELTLEELEEQLQRFEQGSSVRNFLGKFGWKWKVGVGHHSPSQRQQQQEQQPSSSKKKPKTKFKHLKVKNIGGKPDSVIFSRKTRGVWADGQYEPLFLEEAAHLLSLLSAVAFATLRNDVEGAESPLITFDRREPFPHVDPDDYKVRHAPKSRTMMAACALQLTQTKSFPTPCCNRRTFGRSFRALGTAQPKYFATFWGSRGRPSTGPSTTPPVRSASSEG